MKSKYRLRAVIIFMLILVMTGNMLVYAAGPSWTSLSEGLSQDPITGDFIFVTVDKAKTSDIYYRTVGFNISDPDTGDMITIALRACRYDEVQEGKLTTSTWIIPQSDVMAKIANQSTAWYNKIMYPTQDVYLRFDAILKVHDSSKYSADDNGWSGELLSDCTRYGELWDRYNYTELKTLYNWDPSYFDGHFNKLLLIAVKIKEDDPPDPSPDEIIDLLNPDDIIGKDKPDYWTYNYSTTGQFEIGDGIPTSEDITNGYHADEWYGEAGVKARRDAWHSWTFGGWISWKETIVLEDETEYDENGVPYHPSVEVTVNKMRRYEVKRNAGYWYLTGTYFYDLHDVLTESEVFPDGEHKYTSRITTNIQCLVNGEDMTQVADYHFIPNDNFHIDWPKLSAADLDLGVVSGDSESAAAAAFDRLAESKVTASGDIWVKNDTLVINGNTYMSGEPYQYKYFETAPGNIRSYFYIGDDDYGLEIDEENGKIPSVTANGEYFTTITAKYTRICLATFLLRTWKKTPENSAIGDRILTGYTQNEPVRVHTPTISPAIITNPDETQLYPGMENPNADYQLLLDGTYTIEFTPEEHFEHIGYPEMAPDLYNKYCAFKQVAFPFSVQLDGDEYEPDDSDTDVQGNKKLPGYTQWIYVPDFTINDFYIPPWAAEGNNYVIQFRVAPENIIDQYGVNHIDDTEWLLNQTLNGNPLYNYVSIYSITVQVSGRIYGFEATGINDKDTFYNDNNGNGWGFGLGQYFPFCPSKQEKRSGTLNRIGGSSVRYTVDGTLTNSWNPLDTLPFSIGRSKFRSGEGFLRRGNTFTFSLKTIANLWDEEDDYIVIEPSFRYISTSGQVKEDIDLYYNILGEKETTYLVPFGSETDRKSLQEHSIKDVRNDGAYYSEDLSINRVLRQDDGDYSRDKYNAYLHEKNPTWPTDTYQTTNNYLNKKEPCYTLGGIVINNRLRLLTGNLEELEMNLERSGDGLRYIADKNPDGSTYQIREETNPELWDRFRMSMQTWYGAYFIPNQLFVTDATFRADADGDGIKETYDNVHDYAEAKGYIDGTEDFWIKDGYLVVNFKIVSYNNGQPHLIYAAPNKDQWVIEGQPKKTKVGDTPLNTDFEIEVRPGDVAVIDIERTIWDDWYIGYNRIN